MNREDLVRRNSSYYGDLAWNFNTYSKGTYSWHFGVWEPGVRTEYESFLASNRRLLRGTGVGPGSHILDAGSGYGGLATWSAMEHGCHATGITVNPDHVNDAAELAQQRGVGDLCKFHQMDMNDLSGLPDNTFDLVTNQETFNYATDKVEYFKGLRRVLKPGGVWRGIVMTVMEGDLTPDQLKERERACEGWHMMPLMRASEIKAAALEAGLGNFQLNEITPLIYFHATQLEYMGHVSEFLFRVGAGLLIRDPERRSNIRGHFLGGLGYGRGIRRGLFRHMELSATKIDPPTAALPGA
ncbi:MAG: class I SAM-dependent methyltransferase [Myxococcota bacterium]